MIEINNYFINKLRTDESGEYDASENHIRLVDDDGNNLNIEIYINCYRQFRIIINYNMDKIELIEPSIKEINDLILFLIERYQYQEK